MKSSEQSVSISQSKECQPSEISVYKGPLTGPALFREVAKIKAAFPALPKEFYDILTSRLADNNFTDDRLKDAVNNVIDNCPYPTPTIANFISFDKKVKLNTYEDMLKKTNDMGAEVWKLYKKIEIPGRTKPVWVLIDDAKMYNL